MGLDANPMVRVMVWFVVNTVYAFQKLLATAPGSAFASMVGRGMEGSVLTWTNVEQITVVIRMQIVSTLLGRIPAAVGPATKELAFNVNLMALVQERSVMRMPRVKT